MMSRQTYIRSSLAMMALETFPNLIRDALMSDSRFRTDYGVTADARLSFGNDGVEFQRSHLLDAVRSAFKRRKKLPTVRDAAGQIWQVGFEKDKVSERVVFVKGKKRLLVTHFALLSPSWITRLKVLRQEAKRVHLPKSSSDKWEALLRERSPDNDELGEIQDDLHATPIAVRNAIYNSLGAGSTSLGVLVPRSEQYYERLVGRWEAGETFESFVAAGLTRHVHDLISWDPIHGYQLSLLLAAQPKISSVVGAVDMPPAQRAKIFDELTAQGDVLSRAAAVEAGFNHAQAAPELRGSLGQLIDATVAAAPVAQVDPYELLSSLVLLTYGEIANTRILASKPPYWRRLAAIAQASMIANCVAAVGGSAASFVDWANTVRSRVFLLQCFVDAREEPRWIADFAEPDQLKNEIGGRVWSAANAHNAFVAECGWSILLLEDTPGSLRHQLNIPRTFLPGPLEGSSASTLDIPDDNLTEIRADLSAPMVSVASLSAVANASLLFRLPQDVIDLTTDALSRANHYLQRDEARPLVPILLGLATAAAITRSQKLADALFTLVRKYRRFYRKELEIDAAFHVALRACASRANLTDWCVSVGNCVTDMAFVELTRDEAIELHANVTLLCRLVPELWATCGQAEAALQAFVGT
jgi:hypothetical protein